MITIAGFAGAAVIGALARRQLGAYRLPRPAATILVNVTGAFALGLLADTSAPEITVVGVAGLGTLTTFSALADDVVVLWSTDRRQAVTYIVVTMVGGIGAAALGLALAD